jgi:hypothetical protein
MEKLNFLFGISASTYGVIEYKKHSVRQKYEGYLKNGVPSGNGSLTFHNGDKYQGNFKDGRMNGNGKLTYARDNELGRDYYIGEFKDDKQHGNGMLVWKYGDVYEGEFVNDFRSGNGTIRFSSGAMYEGQLLNDKKHGFGKLKFARDDFEGRDYYIGLFKDGKFNGNGKLVLKSGIVHEGEFLDGLITGIFNFLNSFYSLNEHKLKI